MPTQQPATDATASSRPDTQPAKQPAKQPPKPPRSQPDGDAPAGTIVSASIAPLRDALAPLIASAQAGQGIPAISLVLVRGDQTLWQEGFGLADPAGGLPAGPHTRYRVGSLAKPFTAAAILQLEGRGLIDIDQPLTAYLPGFSPRPRFDLTGNPITPRALLSHHSGLPSDLTKGMWAPIPFTTVTAALAEESLSFPPNLVFTYSNLGYSLLGHLLETVTGVGFEPWMQQHLFAPLGMTASGFAARPTALPVGQQASVGADLAVPHRDGASINLLPIRDLPAHGLVSSAADLGRFVTALLCGGLLDGHQVLAPNLIEAMFEAQNSDVALDLDVVTGLGWFLEDGRIAGAGRLVRHSGATLGYSAELALLPEAGVGVVVLANAGHAGGVVKQLANAILTQTLNLMPEALPPDLLLASPPERPRSGAPSHPGGHYATDFGLLALAPNARTGAVALCACMTDETLLLVPDPSGWMQAETAGADQLTGGIAPLGRMRLQTRRIDDREVVVADTGKGEVILGEKVAPAPVPAAWRERLGRYRVINPDPGFPLEGLELKLNDGELCLGYRLPVLSPSHIQVPVQAVSGTEGVVLGLGRNRGDGLRIVEQGDGRWLLRYSGYLAERIGP